MRSRSHLYYGKAKIRYIYCCATFVADSNMKYLGRHVKKAQYFGQILTKFRLSRQITMQATNIKSHGSPKCGATLA